jgi:hypothetical protein
MLAEYMATAKRGTWTQAAQTAKAIAKLRLTHIRTSQDYTELSTEFAARTEGAFYVRLEGAALYGVMLVAPDNSINFSGLASMSVVDAMDYLRAYNATSEIPGWKDYVTWFDEKYALYGAYVTGVTLCGNTTSNVPSYSNPSHSVSVWFDWLRQCAINADCSNVSMGSYRPSANKYSLPMVINPGSSLTRSLNLELII